MKRTKRLFWLAILAITFIQCKRDPQTELIGTWDIEGDHGHVTFKDDNTAYSVMVDPDFSWYPELGWLDDQCHSRDTNHFTWAIDEQKRDKGTLAFEFINDDSTCTSTAYPEYNFYPGGNRVEIGELFSSIDLKRRK